MTTFVGGAILWALWVWSKPRALRHFPPGPKPWPIIGSLLDIPVGHAAEVYFDWGVKYDSESIKLFLIQFYNNLRGTLCALGNILHTSMFGSHVMILNKLEDAIELLENRSQKYSSRLSIPVLKMYSLIHRFAKRLVLTR